MVTRRSKARSSVWALPAVSASSVRLWCTPL
jgi:hypothetical protein